MNYPFLVIAAIVILSMACNEKNPATVTENSPSDARDSSEASLQFFPLEAFLRNEIEYVDSLPVGIMEYRSEGNKTDSAYIKPEKFHSLASEFLPPELDDSNFLKQFKETSFFDRASNNATFYYSATNPENSVRRVDVVTAKGEIYDDVKSIYIEKNFNKGDSSIIKKLIWKPKRNFQIITITSVNSEEPSNEIVKVVWDNRE